MKPKLTKLILAFLIIITVGSTIFLAKKNLKPPSNQNPFIAFLTETFNLIQTNYWDTLSDQELINIYLSAARKFSHSPQLVKADSKDELFKQLEKVVNQDNTPIIADAVLQNLKPPGRSRLYTQQKELELAQNVNNIDPTTDHYQTLDLSKNASLKDINQAFQQKSKTATNEAQLKKIKKAYTTLTDQTTKNIYDTTGANPTMPHQKLTNKIYYIAIKKFSPTTLQELDSIAKKTDQFPQLDTLILDLQDNVGGAIDNLPYFLGPFIGPNQYAYQFIQKGKIEDFKTKSGWLKGLVKFKKVVILINHQTQSSAEVMASVLKKYNVGVLIGTTTRGWGTIESVFPLKTKISNQQTYSVFLVHHLTLKADGQPIQGNGVEPHISILDPNWQQQLKAYYNNPELINQVSNLLLNHSGS